MTDIVVVESTGTTLVLQSAAAQVLEVVQPPANVLEVRDQGVQGPPGPQGTPGTAFANITIDGGGVPIALGVKGSLLIPFACTITAWSLLADQVGSIQLDIFKTSYANYPADVGDSIITSGKPAITGDLKATSSTLTGWTTSVAANDILVFNVDSVSGINRVTIGLSLTRV